MIRHIDEGWGTITVMAKIKKGEGVENHAT
jgi:hypothetical protein